MTYVSHHFHISSKATVNHLANTLSVEEKDVTTIAVRPGVVDTDMQAMIRSDGKEAMEGDHAKFVELHESGKLTKPEDPGHVLAALASNPPKVMSGAFVSWDEESMKPYRR